MAKKRLLIFTDAAEPQVNGVVTTLRETKTHLESMGYAVTMVTPNDFRTVSLPTYKEIQLSLVSRKRLMDIIVEVDPHYIHIATEGPIGYQAMRACKKLGSEFKYTSSYHTKFPEYVNGKLPFIPKTLVYRYLRRIHDNSHCLCTLVTTRSMEKELRSNGFGKIQVWGRGVDPFDFKFSPNRVEGVRKKLRLLYVGRVSREKNIEAFLDIDSKYFIADVEKVVVGDGPDMAKLKQKYSHDSTIQFLGCKKGRGLEEEYQKADVFVFPSKTDTFGIVMLEAMSCGTPVAAYNVTGPKDIIMPRISGAMHEDLTVAVLKCIGINRRSCSNSVALLSWGEVTKNFKRIIEHANEK